MISTETTNINFFEILHEIESRLMSFLNFKFEFSFLISRQNIRDKVKNVVNLTQTRMIINFDKNHKFLNFEHFVLIRLMRADAKKYFILKSFKLFSIKTSSFSIIWKIEDLVYEVKLSKTRKIHFVISTTHLQQAYDKKDKFF